MEISPIRVAGLNHINILTDDLEGTARFYEAVLALTRKVNPALKQGIAGYWMCDAEDNAIVHLVDRTSCAGRYAGYEPGQSTNGFHHVALNCEGIEAMRGRLGELGLTFRENDLSHIGLRQIFVADPNAINLELNFRV